MTKLRILRWGDDPGPPVWAQYTHMGPEKLKCERKIKIREGVTEGMSMPQTLQITQSHGHPDSSTAKPTLDFGS